MSHFSVLVIGDVDSQMAPYQENNMGDCPREYMEFNDATEELTKDYNEKTTPMILEKDGQLAFAYADKYRNPNYSWAGVRDEKKNPEYIYPEGSVQKDVPVKNVYTFEEYAEKYCGYKKDPEIGKYGYWENPNKKWDYYRLGGRWAGSLKLKDGLILSGYGKEHARDWDSPTGIPVGFVDQAKAGDIDWEGMRQERIERAKENWAKYQAESKDPKEARWAGYKYGVEEGVTTEEQYVAQCEPFSTFAVVKDGKWYEKGKMGWWACVSNEKEREKWLGEVGELLKDLPSDTLVSMVDCHI